MYEHILDKISNARTWLLSKLPFYGVLGMRLTPVVDESMDTIAVDGKRLIIGPRFIIKISKNRKQLNFILAHEVLHLALGHLWRCKERNFKIWNFACDYVVNGILWQLINHPDHKVHLAMKEWLEMPNQGLLYPGYFNMTAEEVYKRLLSEGPPPSAKDGNERENGDGESSSADNALSTAGSSGDSDDTESQSGDDSGGNSTNSQSNDGTGSKKGKANSRGGESQASKVASALDKASKNRGESLLDNHDTWMNKDDTDSAYGDWMVAVASTIIRCDGVGDGPNCYSMTGVPNAVRQIISEFFNPTKSWRQILAEFAEPCDRDYTFQPPDSRFHEFDFFLPDEQFTDENITDIYFWCDNSRSVGEPYRILFASELVGAFLQFGDGTEIKYGLFDAHASEPQELFLSKGVEAMLGCGTNPKACFDKMKELGLMEKAKCIVFLTDGKFGLIKKEWAEGVPVIWALVPNYVSYGRKQLEAEGWDRIVVLDPEVED